MTMTEARVIEVTELFSPIKIGNLKLKNRLAYASIENGYAEAGGLITERLIRHFERCAENECGLIFTGSVAVDYDGKGVPSQLEIFDETRWSGLQALAERVHEKGSKIAIQLYHAGRQIAQSKEFHPIAPSAVNCDIFSEYQPPKAMDRPEMERIRQQFQKAAVKAIELGYDMVEVHFAHGYLLHQFLSPRSNKRTDQYGGSLENRMRFPMEVLEDVIRVTAGRVPVGIRISVEEYLPGGLGFEEACVVCKAAEKAGAALISVSAGSYDSMEYMIQPMTVKQGFLREYSRKLRAELSVPVMVAGRLNTADLIRSTIESGDADLVGVGRGFIADTAIGKKLASHQDDEIRKCTGCNQGCLGRIFICEDVRCIFNPQTGFEGIREVRKTTDAKRIGIVGGGITGITLARLFSEAGHHVTVFDDNIGGKLNAMGKPQGREGFQQPVEEIKRLIDKGEITWKPVKIWSDRDLASYQFNRIYVCTGSTIQPLMHSRLPLLEASSAMTTVLPAYHVAVVGGDYRGIEAARYLAMRGKNVTILEKKDHIGDGVGDTFRSRIFEELKEYGIETETNCEIKSEADVLARVKDCELIVQACGYTSNPIKEHFSNAEFVGSVNEDCDILACTEAAWHAFEKTM